MSRKTQWTFPDGVTVTLGDVRLWAQTVGHRVSKRDFWAYVRNWRVVDKVAHHKRQGTFLEVCEQAAKDAGITPRRPRSLGTLARLRAAWPSPANDEKAPLEGALLSSGFLYVNREFWSNSFVEF